MRTRPGAKVRSRFSPYLVAPSGLIRVGEFPRVNPGLCFIGHFGPQIGNVQITGLLAPDYWLLATGYWLIVPEFPFPAPTFHIVCSTSDPHEMKPQLLSALSLLLGALLSACSPAMTGPPYTTGGYVQSPPPNAVVASTPHAQTLEEGEALENQMAREAEEKAKHEQDPANQVRAEQEKIENQIQEEQRKAEGSSQ